MGLHRIKKGLDLPISGKPDQIISEGNPVEKVALIGDDYKGMKPSFSVQVGDYVKLGQLLFIDKKMPKVKYTSPGSGKVVEINRGYRRKFISIVIALEGEEEVTFKSYDEKELYNLKREEAIELLLESGLWTALKSRPFGKIANPDTVPHSIFINAIDTNPLSPEVDKLLSGDREDFRRGLRVLSRLTDGKLYLCKASGADVPVDENISSLSVEEFSGPHPAGNVGTHIHMLDPVGRNKSVWYISAQDVISIGILFTAGRIEVERVISLAGPQVKNPRLVRTRLGASVDDIVKGELKDGENRVISGSVLSGHKAEGPMAFLGRYHRQVSVIAEERERYFLGWLKPGLDVFSVKRVFISGFLPKKLFNFTTSLYGEERAIVPIGSYEKVMPLDIEPTFLLRALAVDDVEEAEKLGCLELEEEDLALCSFVCPSKLDYGAMLRRNLDIIEKEG
ncbi:MAG: Na(+)-translocating NADH-quinone reductase subunit A [Nitrospirae bacterium]|nr:MAG: Na(+)-translocating NADH-quinone reductase subunit A [Nitrospirota bacterium]